MPSKLSVRLMLFLGTTISTIATLEKPICVPGDTCIMEATIESRIIVPEGEKCAVHHKRCSQYKPALKCGFTYSESTQDGRTPYGSHPWLAYITNQTGYTGSGVLLDRYHILTAAHKVYHNKHSLTNLEVYLGVHSRDTLGQAYKRTVLDMVIHQDFDPTTLHNDLAVLRLKAHIPLGYQKNVAAACLPKSNERFVGKRCHVGGWGATSFNAPETSSYYQRQVTVPIVSYETCQKSMKSVLGDTSKIYLDRHGEICAGGEAVKDACTNDGGAPLICKDSAGTRVVAGLVIWGKNCGQPNVYGVYVDVPKYVDWINRAIRKLQK